MDAPTMHPTELQIRNLTTAHSEPFHRKKEEISVNFPLFGISCTKRYFSESLAT